MKNFKKIGILLLVLIMAMSLFTACAKNEPAPAPTLEQEQSETPVADATTYADGVYVAEMPDFDGQGWKDSATVTIAKDKIVAVVFNATNKDTTKVDKLSAVADGTYDMTVAGAISGWDVQAKVIQDYIVETQDTTSLTFDAQGKTDAITGATISYGHFFVLINEALSQAKTK